MAVRTALGASRSIILRQMILEALLLSLAGSAFGTLVAYPLVKGFVHFAPADLPRVNEIHLDWLGYRYQLWLMHSGDRRLQRGSLRILSTAQICTA